MGLGAQVFDVTVRGGLPAGGIAPSVPSHRHEASRAGIFKRFQERLAYATTSPRNVAWPPLVGCARAVPTIPRRATVIVHSAAVSVHSPRLSSQAPESSANPWRVRWRSEATPR